MPKVCKEPPTNKLPDHRNRREDMTSLQEDLATHLRRGTKPWLAFTELTLGRAGSQRADVLAINFSYNTRVRIYECKQSRGDFNSDVNRAKYEGYFDYCHQLYFATPKGLITKEEIPPGCGLIVQSPNKGWQTVKAAPVRTFALERHLLLACLFKKHELVIKERRLSERIRLEENVQLAERARSLGYQIRARLQEVDGEWKRLNEIKSEIDAFTGKKSTTLQQSLRTLRDWLHSSIPGMIHVELAAQLVTLASQLVLNPRGSLEEHYAYKRLRELMEETS